MPTIPPTPTHHNTQPSSHTVPMPPKATKAIKSWGQSDRDLLTNLTNRQLIDITDTTHQNIKQIRDLHFQHRDKKNFRRNFRDYSAAWDLEIENSSARRNGGKMRRLTLLIFCLHTSSNASLPPPPVVLLLITQSRRQQRGCRQRGQRRLHRRRRRRHRRRRRRHRRQRCRQCYCRQRQRLR